MKEFVVRFDLNTTLVGPPTLSTHSSYRVAPELAVQVKVGVLLVVAPGAVSVGREMALTVNAVAADQTPSVVAPIAFTQTR